jgi:Putative binding domain, N-terminal
MHAKGRLPLLVTCLFALGSYALHATTLNMSHDLVPLGIATQNLIPNQPTLDARPLFQATISYIESNPGINLLTVDTGNYYLLSNTQSNAVLIIPLSNITIDLAGSTFYFVGPQLPNGIQLFYCSNLILTNFKLDYLKPPYTHVKLVSVNATNRTLQYALLAGWPDPATFNNLTDPFSGGAIEGYWAAFFRNGAIVPGTSRTLLLAPFSSNTLAVQDNAPWGQSATLSTLKAGDTVVVTTRGGGPPLLVWECKGITLSNISFYGSPTWAIQLFQTGNSTVDHVSVVPRPGTGLIGSDADGIHFVPTGPNNHIRNCTVRATMDDAIIMGSPYMGIVQQQPGTRDLVVNRNAYLRFANGTAMNFVDQNTTLMQPGGTIVSQSPPDSVSPQFNGPVTLTFDRDLPTLTAGTIMVFGSASDQGLGSTIEDNLVQDTYGGRGIWISGANGITVRRNVLRRTSMAAIGLMQETDETGDPGDVGAPVQQITITDNALESALGLAACGTGIGACMGAVEVLSVDNQSFGFSPNAANSGITVANNYIAGSGRSGIWIGETNGVELNNNLVIGSNQRPGLGGIFGIPPPFQQQVEADALVPVVIRYSTGITEAANIVDNNSTIASPVTMPTSMTVPAEAARYSFSMTTAVPGFAWKAASDSSWLLTSVSGAGSGTVWFSVQKNAAMSPRTGHIVIAGQALTVTQKGLTAEPLPISGGPDGSTTPVER